MNKPFLDIITESSGCTLGEYEYVYSRLLENYKIKWNDFEETGFIAKEIKNHSQNLEMYENKIEEITEYKYRKEHFRTHEVFLSTFSYFEKIIASHKAIIKFLDTKKRELEAPQQNKTLHPDEVLINEFEKIFKNDIGFTIFSKMFELYKNETNHLANFSFLFYAMEKDFLVCSQTEFKEFLRIEKYNIDIEKIDSRQSGENKKAKLYNSIKAKYRPSTIKAQ